MRCGLLIIKNLFEYNDVVLRESPGKKSPLLSLPGDSMDFDLFTTRSMQGGKLPENDTGGFICFVILYSEVSGENHKGTHFF